LLEWSSQEGYIGLKVMLLRMWTELTVCG
jgi:hypothetical protein